MGNNQTEKAFEEKRLAQTISLAEEQLKQAKEAADKKKSEIIESDYEKASAMNSNLVVASERPACRDTIYTMPKPSYLDGRTNASNACITSGTSFLSPV